MPGTASFFTAAVSTTTIAASHGHRRSTWVAFLQQRKQKQSLRAGSWLGAAEETFASTEQQPLERIEEYEGRMALLEQRSAKL